MAAPAPGDWTAQAIAHLASAEMEVETLSTEIRSLLSELTRNATSRVRTLFEISQHRVEREDLIDHLHAVQEHNRELLADANRHVDVQQEVAGELAELSRRAAVEGLRKEGEECPSGIDVGRAMSQLRLTGGAQEADQSEDASWYRAENARLNAAYAASELALQSTLASLRHSQAASPSYLPELARLQAASRAAAEELARLTRQRGGHSARLGGCEARREQCERARAGWVLELVIGWDERRREAGEVGGRSGKGCVVRVGR